MRNIIFIKLIVVFLTTLTLTTPTQAQSVTQSEALNVANNWINLIIHQNYHWGGSPEAEVVLITELTRDDRTLGYFCQIAPQGYIIVSLYKNLAPIKAYSNTTNLNPFNEVGLADLIKDKMLDIQQDIEQLTGAQIQSVSTDQLDEILEINYRPAWNIFADEDFDPALHASQADYQALGANYQAGQIMLETSWHQRPPYNDDCPNGGCSWNNYGFFNSNVRVGCVATAGAQIMRYWNWPPQGYAESPYGDPYDWPNIHRRYVYNGAGWFNDEAGNAVTQAQINAVAELNYEVAHAVGMDFGCGESTATTSDMEDVFQDKFIYNDQCDVKHRNDYSANDWFNLLKIEFNQNRPVQYRVEGHSVVGDGWQEPAGLKQYHMNYGWDDSDNAWYTLDALKYGGYDEEYIVREIFPEWALGHTVSGLYINIITLFPWYIDQNTSGSWASFSSGVDFQFLKPGLTITGNGDGVEGNEVAITNTTPADPIKFFLRGDPANQTRIKITEGTIKLTNGGQLTIR
jgi:hypothetical protein